MQNLFDLEKGQKCIVNKVSTKSELYRRLLDIGVIPDTLIECVATSPQGDPKAFLIRGAVIALRKTDCQGISIKELVE